MSIPDIELKIRMSKIPRQETGDSNLHCAAARLTAQVHCHHQPSLYIGLIAGWWLFSIISLRNRPICDALLIRAHLDYETLVMLLIVPNSISNEILQQNKALAFGYQRRQRYGLSFAP